MVKQEYQVYNYKEMGINQENVWEKIQLFLRMIFLYFMNVKIAEPY